MTIFTNSESSVPTTFSNIPNEVEIRLNQHFIRFLAKIKNGFVIEIKASKKNYKAL